MRRSIVRLLVLWLSFSASLAPAAEPVQGGLVSEGWKHKVWLLYPPEKFKADEQPPALPRIEGLKLSAAKGEVEPFLMLVRPEVPLRGVEVRLSALRGPGGAVIPAPAEAARHLGYVYIDEPSGTRMGQKMPFTTGTGLYPDPLFSGVASVRPQHNLQFWVPVSVPRDAVSGVYTGEVTLSFRREGWMPEQAASPLRVPVELTVRGFALPSPSPLRNTAFFSTSALPPERLTPEWLRALYADFAAHRHAPEPLLPSPRLRVRPGPLLEVDLAEWEREAAYALEQAGVAQIFLPVWGAGSDFMQGLYFLWHFPAVSGQRWPARPLPGEPGVFVCDKAGALTPEFRALFGAYLKAAQALVERRGWVGRVLVATMDEPYTAHVSGAGREHDTPARNYPLIAEFAGLVREHAPGLRTFCTSNPVPELEGSIDQWCMRNMDELDKARASKAAAAGQLLVCDNYRTFIDYPLVSARTLGWLCWRAGARGWLTFETMGELGRLWEDAAFVYPQFKGGTVWGMGQLFYPEPLSNRLVPSVRWEMLRKGAEDYEYLWLLRERLAALPPAERESPEAKAAAAFLEHAADGVAGAGSERETAGSAVQPNAQTQGVPHALRERVADWIERFSRR